MISSVPFPVLLHWVLFWKWATFAGMYVSMYVCTYFMCVCCYVGNTTVVVISTEMGVEGNNLRPVGITD